MSKVYAWAHPPWDSGYGNPTSAFFPNANLSHINGNTNSRISNNTTGIATPGSIFNANSNYVLGKAPMGLNSPV